MPICIGSGWQKPTYIGDEVNLEGEECYPSISNTRNLLFISTPTKEGEIFYAQWNGQHYETPQPIAAINTPSVEVETTPFLAPDESYILFSQPLSLDIYISLRQDDGFFS